MLINLTFNVTYENVSIKPFLLTRVQFFYSLSILSVLFFSLETIKLLDLNEKLNRTLISNELFIMMI